MVYAESYLNAASVLRKLPNFWPGPNNTRRQTKAKNYNETTSHDQDQGHTRWAKTNGKREPTSRTNETTAARDERNHRERVTDKANGDTKDQAATNPNP